MVNITDKAMEKLQERAMGQLPLTDRMSMLVRKLEAICKNPVVEAVFKEAVAHVNSTMMSGKENPWKYFTIENFIHYFRCKSTYFPKPADGLGFIMPFTWFYLNNTHAYYVLNTFKSETESIGAESFTREIFNWTVEFIVERGRFMDSPDSLMYVMLNEIMLLQHYEALVRCLPLD